MDRRKDILWRIYILYIGVLLVAVGIVWKIFTIQFIQGDHWRQKAEMLSKDTFLVKAPRGNIMASDSSYLAVSISMYDLYMDTRSDAITDKIWSENIDSLAWNLATVFKDRSEADYKKLLSKGRREGNRYLALKKKVSRGTWKKVKKFPIFRMGGYKGGLIVEERNIRIKPYGNLASRTIGREPGENQGLGLEAAYEEYLKGDEGLRLMEKLSGGVWRPVDRENTIDPVDGYDVITTIDPKLQDVAESELERQLTMHNAGHGCVVLMEVATGDIKAIANLQKNTDGKYYESFNFAIGEAVEPGSTFKLATMLALAEDGFLDTTAYVETGNGVLRIYDHTLNDAHDGGHGTITTKHSFEVSSNIAMAKLVVRYYGNDPQKFVDHLKKLHLHEPLGLELPGEANPFVRNKGDKGWSGLSLPMMAIGYETLITPMQILTLYNAVANNGKMVKPRFVTEIRDRSQVVKKNDVVVIEEKIASDQTLGMLRAMLEGVVLRGTATNLRKSIFPIAGKTGTAQIANNGEGYRGAGGIMYRASFCGYFPADKPKYSCIVVVNAPSNSVYYGNLVAGPIFKAVADKVYAYAYDINQEYYRNEHPLYSYKVPVCKNGYSSDLLAVLGRIGLRHQGLEDQGVWAITTAREQFVELKPAGIQQDKMPDVRGMGIRDALYLLEKLGIDQVHINGRGTVKQQSVEPGTPVENITLVDLELS